LILPRRKPIHPPLDSPFLHHLLRCSFPVVKTLHLVERLVIVLLNAVFLKFVAVIVVDIAFAFLETRIRNCGRPRLEARRLLGSNRVITVSLGKESPMLAQGSEIGIVLRSEQIPTGKDSSTLAHRGRVVAGTLLTLRTGPAVHGKAATAFLPGLGKMRWVATLAGIGINVVRPIPVNFKRLGRVTRATVTVTASGVTAAVLGAAGAFEILVGALRKLVVMLAGATVVEEEAAATGMILWALERETGALEVVVGDERAVVVTQAGAAGVRD
jgi:hypothetical protein